MAALTREGSRRGPIRHGRYCGRLGRLSPQSVRVGARMPECQMGGPNTVTGMPNERGELGMPNAGMPNRDSLYGKKFGLHVRVQAHMVLALIPAEDVLQCDQSQVVTHGCIECLY